MAELIRFITSEYAQHIFWILIFIGVVLIAYVPIKLLEKRRELAYQQGLRHFSESNGLIYFGNGNGRESLEVLFGEHLKGFSADSVVEGAYRGKNLKFLNGMHSSREFLQDQTLVCCQLKKISLKNFSLEFMGNQEIDIEQEEKEIKEFGSSSRREMIRQIIEDKMKHSGSIGRSMLDVHCRENTLMFVAWKRIPLATLENYLDDICEIIDKIDR